MATAINDRELCGVLSVVESVFDVWLRVKLREGDVVEGDANGT